jgi:FkbM family methyltransferase
MLSSLIKKMRRSPFEFQVGAGQTIGDIVFAPLDAKGIEPVVVDLGARNGMMLLPASYARRARLIGFEPNPEEAKKLITKTTDSRKHGGFLPPFKREEYHPYAVWRKRERRPLYITAGPGACTLMGATDERITGRMYQDMRTPARLKRYYDNATRVLRTEEVDCITLDEVLAPNEIVDFLKLDVEGAELACMEGAQKLISEHRALFVRSEFVTFPYYKEHDVFGKQHVFLNDRGYRLIGIDLSHHTYRRGPRDLPETADRRMIYAGDATYVPDPDRIDISPEHKQRIAAMAFIFRFSTLALSLMDEAKLTSANDIARIEKTLRSTYTIDRLKEIYAELPTSIARMVRG